MAQDKRSWFAQVVIAMMIFCGLVWIWTVAFIIAWPWEKSATWKPDFRVAAVCDKGEICSFPYGELEAARGKGLFSSLTLPGEAGEVMETKGWLQWKKVGSLIEAKSSSWYFQTVIRYKVEDDKPVLIEYQDVSAKAFYYGLLAAAFSLLGLYLRKLRR